MEHIIEASFVIHYKQSLHAAQTSSLLNTSQTGDFVRRQQKPNNMDCYFLRFFSHLCRMQDPYEQESSK